MKGTRVISSLVVSLAVFLLIAVFVGWIAEAEVSARDMKIWATRADYTRETGKRITSYSEAPSLAKLVAEGKLPPVQNRLPEEPLVVGVAEEIGKYGGTLVAHSPSKAAWNDIVLSFLLDDAVMLSNDTGSILPGWAISYNISDDKKVLTINFRKGMKWSDGEPFTVDDVIFWWEGDMTNPEVTPSVWTAWKSGGEPLKFQKVDDHTLRIVSKEPYPSLIFYLAQYYSQQARMFHPTHYLKKWHIKYNDKANELAKQEGFDNWAKAFNFHKQFEPFPNDENLPTISAWRMKKMGTTEAIYERNPYYWKIDTAGNQLPYIDELVCAFVPNPETINMKAVAGEFDYIVLDLSLKNYPLYKENEGKGRYRLLRWLSTEGNIATYSFNLNHKDPVLKKIFNDIRFRRAMSLAIDRNAINQTLFFGLATPRQTTVIPETSFYKPAWAESYAQYDPAKANQLLDEMGLDKRDKDNFRLRPDGKTLSIVINVHNIEMYLPITEMVAEFWNKVGVKTTVKEVSWELFFTRRDALEFDVDIWHLGLAMEGSLYANPERFAPFGGENRPGPAWGQWFDTNGKEGEEPPQIVKDTYKWIKEWKTVPRTDPRYREIAQRIYDSYAENLWTIGTVGLAPLPVIVRENLANVPATGYHGNDQGFGRTFAPWQWFFK
ncbi:MAG: ABC transporter substrate-binding protein [bacterium]